MNKKMAIGIFIFALALAGKPAIAGDHDHKEGERQEHKRGEKAHQGEIEHEDDKDGHAQKDGENKGHDHEQGEEEEAKNVGPEKGITSYDEENGFTLSKEASKHFSLETMVLNASISWTVPTSALLLTGEDKSVYRVRKGSFKRIDVKIVHKNKTQAVIRSGELTSGDQVVTKGVGFLRLGELDVTSGESGHHH